MITAPPHYGANLIKRFLSFIHFSTGTLVEAVCIHLTSPFSGRMPVSPLPLVPRPRPLTSPPPKKKKIKKNQALPSPALWIASPLVWKLMPASRCTPSRRDPDVRIYLFIFYLFIYLFINLSIYLSSWSLHRNVINLLILISIGISIIVVSNNYLIQKYCN